MSKAKPRKWSAQKRANKSINNDTSLTPKKEIPPNKSLDNMSVININLALFGVLIALAFSYFVYFSHQLTEVKSDIYLKITEINAIDPPFPWSFLSIAGHDEYFYLKRREILFEEFRRASEILQKSNLDEAQKTQLGKKVQVLITQMAYFFPYKRMVDFQKDGSLKFDPNRFKSIETSESLRTNVPAYAQSSDADKTYSTVFITEQINHIMESHRRFTLELKACKNEIIEAMYLASGLKNKYDHARLSKYIESLIEYLENHHRLAIPLGLTITKYNYLLKRSNPKAILLLSSIILAQFISGVVLPLFWKRSRNMKLLMAISLAAFVFGVVVLFKESIYSMPI